MSNTLLIIDPNSNEVIFRSSESRITVGRVDSNDLFVPHETVSRSHAEFNNVGQEWAFVDLGSTNGSFLNGDQLHPHIPVLIRAGDIVRFGDVEAIVQEEGAIRSVPSLYVFRKSTYEGEFPISSTTDFSFGGMNATIPADELNTKELIFIVRQDESFQGEGALMMSCKFPDITPVVNGRDVSGRVALSDRDTIQIGSINMLVSSRSAKEFNKKVSEVNSQLAIPEQGKAENAGDEIPDYLKTRIGADGWEDPLEKKRKRTSTVFSLDEVGEDYTERRSSSTLRSQAELVGVQRFSRPNLETVKKDEQKKQRKQAFIGMATILVVFVMLLVLAGLYKDFIGAMVF